MPRTPRVHKPASGRLPTFWRQLEFACLIGTIPAFYLAALATRRPLAMGLYAAAGLASAAVIADEWRRDERRRKPEAVLSHFRLNGLLVIGLFSCALLPQGDGLDLLLLRLGTAMLVVLRAGASLNPWFWRNDLPRLLTLATGLLALCGLGFWWLEPQAHSFGDGVWLAFATAATVGYGDIVPSTPASKIFAVFVVLLGFTVLSLVTASVAAMWVRTEERKIEKDMLHDLHRELRLVRDAIDALRSERSVERRPDAVEPDPRPATPQPGPEGIA